MLSHYAGYHASDFYVHWLREYASEAVSIFFVVAGLGSYYSFRTLERKSGCGGFKPRMFIDYYFKRAVRIYPLYWLSLFSLPFIIPAFGMLHQFTLHTLAIYLAYPGVSAPSVYWFVPSLMQCYLLAPLVYLAFRRLSLRNYVIFWVGMALLFVLVSFRFARLIDLFGGFGLPDPQALFYRPMFLSNLVLFALGYSIPVMYRQFPASLRKNHVPWVMAGFMLLMMYVLRDANTLFAQSHLLLFPLFIASVFIFCLSLVSVEPPLPAGRLLIPLGDNSYSLYLFHRHYYGLLALAGVIVDGSLGSFLLTCLLFPLFFIACAQLERANRALAGGLIQIFPRRSQVAVQESDF